MTRFAIRCAAFLLMGTLFAQDDLERLKAQVAAQQEQINELRRMVEAQTKMLAKALPSAFAAPAPAPVPERVVETAGAPLSVDAGGVTITPTGFVDISQVWRTKTVSSGLPTNFASIPFGNTVDGHRSQTLSSAANSRVGMQVNAMVSGFRLMGVVETDFLGYQPGNVSTTSNSFGLRLRLAFADVQKGKWEFLGGQAWSLLTPGRKGIPALPAGVFTTEDLDPNMQSGLVWARNPQLRAVYRPKKSVSLGVSLESGDTYAGGSGGAGTVTLPAALSPNYFNQIDLGSGGAGVPNPRTDLIGKVAFDPQLGGRYLHLEAAGLLSRFVFFNPLNNQSFSATASGVAVNAGFEIVKNLSLFTANFYSNGGGRFIYGEAPGLIIRGNGAPSLVHSMSTVDGVEYQLGRKWRFWAFYGGTYIDRETAIDPSNGMPVGYGYAGSPNAQNRTIQEATGGFTRIFWQNPKFGRLQFSGQVSWLVRSPWYAAPGEPRGAHLNMLYLGFRYVLPGAPPPVE